jgi:hypothetical protein
MMERHRHERHCHPRRAAYRRGAAARERLPGRLARHCSFPHVPARLTGSREQNRPAVLPVAG